MTDRHSLPKHLKKLPVSLLKDLLNKARGNDPQDELDGATVEAIRDQIDYLEYLKESKWAEARDEA